MSQITVPQLNLNQLRIFEATYRLRSMTMAANELFLTQSGVSQHIKSLERDLGTPLFSRSRHELFPTEAAQELYSGCEKGFLELKNAVEKITEGKGKKISGLIRIGVPTEFGNNVVIPHVALWGQQFPEVKFEFIYGYGQEMRNLLETGGVDLAFLDHLKGNSRVITHRVYTETLNLVASKDYMMKKGLLHFREKLQSFLDLDFVEYQPNEPVLRMWFQHHFGKKNVPLKVKAWAVNVAGVAKLIQSGLGVGVVPDHIIHLWKSQNMDLHLFKGSKEFLKNEISLAWVKNKPLSAAGTEFKNYTLKKFANN
jgi:DNA-binding transcriptional LysR family regulator